MKFFIAFAFFDEAKEAASFMNRTFDAGAWTVDSDEAFSSRTAASSCRRLLILALSSSKLSLYKRQLHVDHDYFYATGPNAATSRRERYD